MANILQRLLTMGEGKQKREIELIVEQVNAFEPEMHALTDDALRAKTDEFRTRFADGETLDELLPEAFAAVREASIRSLGMRHFDVQIFGGVVLHRGTIAEMKTGEGKTLVATLPVYLNALTGRGVHLVTVNDYLAARDATWMGKLYRFLGLEVGVIPADENTEARREAAKVGITYGLTEDRDARKRAYAADVTYGTNAEFGFDYLRDNMAVYPDDRVQRGHYYAIVDEVDSILIDEARTPLIISGQGERSADTYRSFAKVVPRLKMGEDFEMEEEKRTIWATEDGLAKAESMLGIKDLYSADPSGQLVNHLQQALRAQFLFKKDVDYVIADGEVKIVDEYTGRVMEGRRWSEGLHQAIEAKEKVHVKEENQTLATVTIQNYFRMYEKMAGMTGTAVTEDAEFREIYSLPVLAIPPNQPVARADEDDLVYRTVEAKYDAVVEDIVARAGEGQPCLVGTISVENSEHLSRLLDKRGVKHNVLNAKRHDREAHVVSQAGRLGAVTIATNMAGRGTDIVLGGNPNELYKDILIDRGVKVDEATPEQEESARARAREICAAEHEQVVAAGGLAVIGTERHESRRIDDQLRGRGGRQGDPGLSQFYLSLGDDLMRLFGGDRMDSISRLMERTQIPDDMPIQAGLVSKALSGAQKKVELINFAARKHVLEYDDVIKVQRETIYGERNAILDGKDIHGRVQDMIESTVLEGVLSFCPEKTYSEEWDWPGLKAWVTDLTGSDLDVEAEREASDNGHALAMLLAERALARYQEREDELGPEQLRDLERFVMLNVIDRKWLDHLNELDYLREGIGLRAMGQRDPVVEYKNEAFDMFAAMVGGINEDFLRTIFHIAVVQEPVMQSAAAREVSYTAPSESSIFTGAVATADTFGGNTSPDAMAATAAAVGGKAATVVKDKDDAWANAGRNDPCPCGSGKKYKKCHGASA
ncbi:MAG: preprotein translocase subunit SecA [Coriobacteriia bacterium]|nr:preprotein translocase subunit SecA [Coriobacteriia bacterium]